MKVLHGMTEVAGQGIYTVQGLRANGVDADMAVWRRNSANYAKEIGLTDLEIGRSKVKYPAYVFKMGAFALKAQMHYDIFHFHFGNSLMIRYLDLPADRLLHKKYFCEFHGSDIRFLYHDIEYKYAGSKWVDPGIKKRQQKNIKRLIDGACGVILHDEELAPHLPDGITTPVYIVPLRVDISRIRLILSEPKKKPVIVHAPSDRKGKGTEGILKALQKVRSDYELILVEGKPQQEALRIYEKADIIIDQIGGGTYGVFAIEAMAMGKPVITYITEEMKKSLPETMPIVSAEFHDLAEIVDDLLTDVEKRRALGAAGRAYAERYHDNVKVTRFLKQIYDGSIEDRNLFKLL